MGFTASLERRKQVVQLAQRHGFLILEDDAYFELRFEGEQLPSYYELDKSRSHVVRTGTFSKILGAGVRLGWAIGPPDILQAMMLYKFDLGSSPFMSRIVAEYMGTHLQEHVTELCGVYRGKRDAMLEALEAGLGGVATWNRPDGGFFIWVKLPDGVDSAEVERESMARGVDIWPGSAFRMDGAEDGHVRLAYSFETPEKIREGVAVFSYVVRDLHK
jgi:DNA-binding transcriptional MocR family regulator